MEKNKYHRRFEKLTWLCAKNRKSMFLDKEGNKDTQECKISMFL